MGLEIVEIVMDIEEAFGARFDWDGRLRTVADLQAVVVEGLEHAVHQSETEARTRYQREVFAALGIGPEDAERPILEAVPDLPRRLPDLAVTSWWNLPYRMRRPRMVVIGLWALTPVVTVGLALASPRDRSVAVVGIIFGPMAVLVLAFLLDRWRPRLPDLRGATARGVVEAAVTRFLKQDPEARNTWIVDGQVRRSAVMERVVAILAERSGRPVAGIRPQHRLVQDLGLD